MIFLFSIGFNVAVEELTIKGTMQIILDMSMDVPFPHFSKATTFFTERLVKLFIFLTTTTHFLF